MSPLSARTGAVQVTILIEGAKGESVLDAWRTAGETMEPSLKAELSRHE